MLEHFQNFLWEAIKWSTVRADIKPRSSIWSSNRYVKVWNRPKSNSCCLTALSFPRILSKSCFKKIYIYTPPVSMSRWHPCESTVTLQAAHILGLYSPAPGIYVFRSQKQKQNMHFWTFCDLKLRRFSNRNQIILKFNILFLWQISSVETSDWGHFKIWEAVSAVMRHEH